jgi:ribosomal protein L11 methyltransferase
MIRLAVRVQRREAELVLAELLELAPSGVEEVAIGTEIVEYAVYGAPGELPNLPDLRAAAGGALVDLRTEEIADDWSERWRAFHRPLVLGDRLTVRPPWEPPGATAVDVEIDPGQAFGTGAHATTRLCLELMLEQPQATGSFVDVGCGSGVLAIAAAALGLHPVTALDYDPAAVAATEENARRNGVTLCAELFDLRRDQVPDGDLVAANVLAGPLVAWAAHQRHLPEQLILSGILTTEVDLVSGAFAARGMVRRRRLTWGEWTALRMSRHRVDNPRARNLGHGADAAGSALIDPSTRRL